MSRLGITGITLSVEFGDTTYGSGTKSFMNVSARVPDGDTIPVDDPREAIEGGLEMYMTAWTTLMASRLVVGTIKKDDFQESMAILKDRLETIKAKLCK